ncbi:MAG: putative lipid II flippase FtsW [Proteobacteria bacterium]|nr:putative lipid II flippase FtsW [Pseudomonadota bacterium]MBU4470896.1 putative lipid II flippase FtsW [Pseudomonadota bacterium]MCG2751894.1 putative lipid II flippase FtsW [Desulfobacteraceae bacterium]
MENMPPRNTESVIKYDVALLFPVLFLVGMGIVMVYSASSALALKKYGTDLFFIKKQAIFSIAGFMALILFIHLPYRIYKALAYPILVVAVGLLILIHIPGIGHSAGGSKRWILLAGVSFQPSEFAKLAMIIFMAYSLNKKKDRMKEFSIGFMPHILITGLLCGLIITQPDFGTVVIIGSITMAMLFIGGAKISHLAGMLLVAVPAGGLFMTTADYRVRRLMSFWDPWKYPLDEGYQVVNSLMAFGNGGIWGQGMGKGVQKLFYLPEPHTDFIFSVIGEELGLVGVLFILVLYSWIFWRGLMISLRTEDTFGSLLAAGITIALGLQVFVNMGVALGLLPTKGLTLPFLSYGGTSLIFSMVSVGILMNISSGIQTIRPVRSSSGRMRVKLSHELSS